MLSNQQQAAVEAEVRDACARSSFEHATTLAVKSYGPEVLGYLFAVTRNQADTDDAFAVFCESLWTGLPAFQWRSSLRTWIYCVARSALGRVMRDPHRKPGRGVPLSQAGVAEAAAAVRTATMEFLRTDFKDKVEEIKQQLSLEDQTLLILRVSRNMSWNDIAQVMSDGDDAGEEELKRKAAALRKRFERTKESLRKLVRTGEEDA